MSRKICIVLLFLSIIIIPATAQSYDQLTSQLDFGLSFDTLSEMSRNELEDIKDSGVFFIVEGTIASLNITPANASVIFTIATGRWQYDGSMTIYKANITLSDEKWIAIFSDPENNNFISENSRVLVLGQLREYSISENNSVLEITGYDVRLIP